MNDPSLVHQVETDSVLRLFMGSVTDQAVFTLDPDGIITTWNEGCARLKGYAPEEAIGRHFRMLYTDEDQASGHPEHNLAKAREDGQYHEERVRVRKGGEGFIAEVSIYPLEEDGRTGGFAKIVRDVSQRVRHEAERAGLEAELGAERNRLLSLVEDAPAFVAMLDGPELSFAYANDAYQILVGRRAVVGLPLLVSLPEVAGQGHAEMLQDVMATGRPFAATESLLALRPDSDGRLEERFVDLSCQPARDAMGRIVGVLIHGVDVTEQVMARRRVEGMNAELEERVARRTEELAAAAREAEGFSYAIAHDLRTPLRAIVSTASLLLEEAGPRLDEEQRGMLVRQAHNALRMGDLIDALLRLSRLSRVAMRRVPLDLTEMARDVAAELEPRCAVVVQDGMAAEGDAALVRSAIENLLGNAFKFSPGGGAVTVGETDGAFWVRDEGVGFDARYAEKAFLPFERLVADSEFPGTGIGLANVRRIVERHGGKVWAESELGKGATFWFTLG